MQKTLIMTCLLVAFGLVEANAQYGYGYGRPGYGRYPSQRYPRRVQRQSLPPFKPIVQLSFGYGFPNLDKDQMAQFYNYYRGNVAQTGPVTGALDVQFSRNTSIGVMVSHGEVSAPYYDYNSNSSIPAVYGRLDNWAVMVNMLHHMPGNETFSPYIRTAVGVNIWNQNYTDGNGSKLNFIEQPNQLAYQVGIGTNINFSKNTSFFVEAGYGKFILHGGLAFRL